MTLTKDAIINLLKTNDTAIARALLALNARQTEDERVVKHTKHHNGRGFRPCHARMGTSMANFYRDRGFLSAGQLAYWRRVTPAGKMRIEIYAGQLLEVAIENRARKAQEQELELAA
jgi:hypothetical protein